MEAKDTVMNFMRIEEIDAKNATSNFTDALVDVAREQAEISFMAGKKEGIREVVEWIKNYWTGLGSYNIPLKDWQAKLKEWGLK